MAQVLIVYATRFGQAEKIARRIAQTLARDGHQTQLVDAEQPRLDLEGRDFDLAVVGGSVHAQKYAPALARFVRQQRSLLQRIPSAFFSVSLAVASRAHDGRSQITALNEKFFEQTGWRPVRVELMAGALAYSKYNWLIRFVMRSIAKKEGGDTDTARDYEYTDWEAVDRFATDFVRTSGATAASEAAVAPAVSTPAEPGEVTAAGPGAIPPASPGPKHPAPGRSPTG